VPVALFLVAGASCAPDRPPGPTSRAVAGRIISISPNCTETIGLLGQTQRLVAVSSFCVWPPEAMKLPRVGGLFDPSLEAMVQLRPDLIILRGRNKAVEQLAADRGIELFRDRTESFEDIYATVRELGRLLDCSQRAEDAIDQMRRSLERIGRAVKNRRRPRVMLTLSRNPDDPGQYMTASRGTYMHEMIVFAGGENVFAELAVPYPQVTPEAILSARPEVIIETMPESKDQEGLEVKLRSQWRRLGPIPAVQNDRIYVLTDEHAQIPSPRIVAIVARLARLLHPEAGID